MQPITRKQARRLAEDPYYFAMMLDDFQLENVIVTFVEVLNKRKLNRGGKNQ